MSFAVAEELVKTNPILSIGGALRALPKQKHNPILRESEIKEFKKQLAGSSCHLSTKLGLEIILHTFVRTGELREAQWSEIDFDDSVWKIPSSRTKMDREHWVPLSPYVLNLFMDLKAISQESEFVLSQISRNSCIN